MSHNLFNSYVDVNFLSLCFVFKSAWKELGDLSVFTGCPIISVTMFSIKKKMRREKLKVFEVEEASVK